MLQPTPSPAEPSVDPRPPYLVIMAGGGGTRLWPHSRRNRPKQFLPILPGGETLLAATVRRSAPVVDITRTLIVTTAEQVAQVRHCLPQLPIDNILVEPIGRNTAPCIGLSAQSRMVKSGNKVKQQGSGINNFGITHKRNST